MTLNIVPTMAKWLLMAACSSACTASLAVADLSQSTSRVGLASLYPAQCRRLQVCVGEASALQNPTPVLCGPVSGSLATKVRFLAKQRGPCPPCFPTRPPQERRG